MGERTVISTNIARTTGSPHRGKKRQKKKINLKWTEDLKLKANAIKIL